MPLTSSAETSQQKIAPTLFVIYSRYALLSWDILLLSVWKLLYDSGRVIAYLSVSKYPVLCL